MPGLCSSCQPPRVPQVAAPQFLTLKIGQYTTRPDVNNYVCVTLKTNYLFRSNSTAEVSSTPRPKLQISPIAPHASLTPQP